VIKPVIKYWHRNIGLKFVTIGSISQINEVQEPSFWKRSETT